MALYPARRRRNVIWMGLSTAAAAFGLAWLFLILVVLLWKGFSGLTPAVFTQMTPPPDSAGGRKNLPKPFFGVGVNCLSEIAAHHRPLECHQPTSLPECQLEGGNVAVSDEDLRVAGDKSIIEE